MSNFKQATVTKILINNKQINPFTNKEFTDDEHKLYDYEGTGIIKTLPFEYFKNSPLHFPITEKRNNEAQIDPFSQKPFTFDPNNVNYEDPKTITDAEKKFDKTTVIKSVPLIYLYYLHIHPVHHYLLYGALALGAIASIATLPFGVGEAGLAAEGAEVAALGTSAAIGESAVAVGETAAIGESAVAVGETAATVGETASTVGESVATVGETASTVGESASTVGEAAIESTTGVGTIGKTIKSTFSMNKDSFNTEKLKEGIENTQESLDKVSDASNTIAQVTAPLAPTKDDNTPVTGQGEISYLTILRILIVVITVLIILILYVTYSKLSSKSKMHITIEQ